MQSILQGCPYVGQQFIHMMATDGLHCQIHVSHVSSVPSSVLFLLCLYVTISVVGQLG